jgi:HAMP domain-containing protein
MSAEQFWGLVQLLVLLLVMVGAVAALSAWKRRGEQLDRIEAEPRDPSGPRDS